MCLAKIYERNMDQEKVLIAENIARLKPAGDQLQVTDLFGTSKVISGYLDSLDFENSIVWIRKEETDSDRKEH